MATASVPKVTGRPLLSSCHEGNERCLKGGVSFMEDYTYHFSAKGDKVLGAHMLRSAIRLQPRNPGLIFCLSRSAARLTRCVLFSSANTGPAIGASIMDMGQRFRIVANVVDVVPTDEPLPNLPVARALWLRVPTSRWLLLPGSSRSRASHQLRYAVTAEHLRDFTEMAGVEFLLIDESTKVGELQDKLRWNDLYFQLIRGYRLNVDYFIFRILLRMQPG